MTAPRLSRSFAAIAALEAHRGPTLLFHKINPPSLAPLATRLLHGAAYRSKDYWREPWFVPDRLLQRPANDHVKIDHGTSLSQGTDASAP